MKNSIQNILYISNNSLPSFYLNIKKKKFNSLITEFEENIFTKIVKIRKDKNDTYGIKESNYSDSNDSNYSNSNDSNDVDSNESLQNHNIISTSNNEIEIPLDCFSKEYIDNEQESCHSPSLYNSDCSNNSKNSCNSQDYCNDINMSHNENLNKIYYNKFNIDSKYNIIFENYNLNNILESIDKNWGEWIIT